MDGLGILEETLKDRLPRDKEQAVSGRDLSVILGVPGTYIRRAVNNLRSNGVPVCSGANGYWVSVDPVEIRETVNSLMGRAASIQAAADGLSKWI